ncbi:MAG: hypothetical protein WD512_18635 [Candidatus Paceibacterota bacterium]
MTTNYNYQEMSYKAIDCASVNTSQNMYDDENDEVMKRAEDINNNYIYCGYHTDNHDYFGYDTILHYILKETLGSRDIKTLEPYEYDDEVWPSDKHYKYCKRTLGK